MKILLAIVITFIATALWQLLTTNKIRKNNLMMASSLVSEMERMAQKLGHNDLGDYFKTEKGEEYAKTAMVNISNYLMSHTDKGTGVQ